MTREELATRFEKAGKKGMDDAASKWNMGASFVLGLALLPFSSFAGILMLSLPSIYFGIGFTLFGIGTITKPKKTATVLTPHYDS